VSLRFSGEGSAWPPRVAAETSVPLSAAIVEGRDVLLAAVAREGALLFRGFPVASAEDFDAVVGAFGLAPFSYADSLSNAVRVELTPRVFTVNEAPPEAIIHLHHELAQTPSAPTHLFFFCERAPAKGGATMLCRSDLLFEALEAERPSFARACAEKGFVYTVRMPPGDDAGSGQGRSWRRTFGVADREGACKAMERLGYTGTWCAGDWLEAASPVLPAVRMLGDGRRSFFNQLIAASAGWARGEGTAPVVFGDGTPIDPEDVRAAIRLAESIGVDLDWQAGDVAVVDNRRVMHGRRHFQGERRVLAAFGIEGESQVQGVMR